MIFQWHTSEGVVLNALLHVLNVEANEYWYLLLNRSSPPNRWSTNRRSDTTWSGVAIQKAPIHFHDNRFCSSSSQLIVEYIVIENHWKVLLTFYLHIIRYHHILLQYRVHDTHSDTTTSTPIQLSTWTLQLFAEQMNNQIALIHHDSYSKEGKKINYYMIS